MNINLTLFAQAITFFAFIWFCVRFVWPPVIRAIEDRRKTIAEGLAAADKGNKSLDEAKVQIAALLDEARGQARQIIDQAQVRANTLMDEARTGADQERERIINAGQAEVQQQINRARDELRSQVGTLAVAGAERILAREIDPRAHQELLDQLAAQI
jgi:F-type H+-transporting ATPase subunit b